jgi:hypothetical protein
MQMAVLAPSSVIRVFAVRVAILFLIFRACAVSWRAQILWLVPPFCVSTPLCSIILRLRYVRLLPTRSLPQTRTVVRVISVGIWVIQSKDIDAATEYLRREQSMLGRPKCQQSDAPITEAALVIHHSDTEKLFSFQGHLRSLSASRLQGAKMWAEWLRVNWKGFGRNRQCCSEAKSWETSVKGWRCLRQDLNPAPPILSARLLFLDQPVRRWSPYFKFHSRNRCLYVKFEVFTAMTMNNGIFCDVTPCGSCKNRRFGGT